MANSGPNTNKAQFFITYACELSVHFVGPADRAL
jgi:cyclophilin family peptidyl-prolyl cis-trans isomerase